MNAMESVPTSAAIRQLCLLVPTTTFPPPASSPLLQLAQGLQQLLQRHVQQLQLQQLPPATRKARH